MADGTIRADADKIASSVSVFRGGGDKVADVAFPGVAAGVGAALPGGAVVGQALGRACGAAAVCAARGAGRLTGLADFADQAHRFLEAEDEDFAELLGKVVGR